MGSACGVASVVKLVPPARNVRPSTASGARGADGHVSAALGPADAEAHLGSAVHGSVSFFSTPAGAWARPRVNLPLTWGALISAARRCSQRLRIQVRIQFSRACERLQPCQHRALADPASISSAAPTGTLGLPDICWPARGWRRAGPGLRAP